MGIDYQKKVFIISEYDFSEKRFSNNENKLDGMNLTR